MKQIDSLGDLSPDPRNARRHNPRNVGMIEQALGEVGAGRSIVIDEDGVVLAGNATIEAAAQAGIERVQVVEADGNTIVAVRRSGLTPEQKTKLALYDNRAAELADWDAGVLAALAEETDLSQLFRDDELAALLADAGTVDIGGAGDDFDATPADGPTRTHLGDVWEIGPHRLLVGDCTDAANVERLMGGERAALVVTSPPYGVGKEYEQGGVEEWRETITGAFGCAATVAPLWFVNLADRRTGNDGYEVHTYGVMVALFTDMGFNLIGTRVWVKDPAWAGQSPYWNHTYKPVDDFEFLGLFASEKPKHKPRLSRDDNNEWGYRGCWTFASVGENKEHSAAFPIELPARAIRMLTDNGDTIYDPFLGSGTTLIAAHQTGRRCYGMEISPRYADVILRRAEAAGLSCVRYGSE